MSEETTEKSGVVEDKRETTGSAELIFEVMKSKMKSIVGKWNDFNLYVGTHDDLWHIAKVIERELKKPNGAIEPHSAGGEKE